MRRTPATLSVLAVLTAAGLARAQEFPQTFDDITTLTTSHDWFSINRSDPLGTTGYYQGDLTYFGPEASTSYLATDYTCGSGLSTLSNWFITPILGLQNGQQFSFWTRTADSNPYPDRLQVRLSTAGTSVNVGATATSVGDFSTLLLDIDPDYISSEYPAVWTQYVITLSGLPAGTTPGRIAFRYFVENGGPFGSNSLYIGIDEADYNGSVIPPATGACCADDGTCSVLTQNSCGLAGGHYRGDNVTCVAAACPSAACCLADGSCITTGPGGCTSRNGVYRGDATTCGAVTCTPRVFMPVALNWNFNGMVQAGSEQGTTNRDNPTGFRSVSDRALLADGSSGSINNFPIIDTDFMTFSVVSQPGQLDVVHLGDRNQVDNGTAAWGSNANAGLQPTWLPNSDQTGPQVSDVSSLHATFTNAASLGVLYQISNGGGHFDVKLTFSDSSSATVTLYGPDWYGDAAAPVLLAGSGVATQRELGVYSATGSIDVANFDSPLNVVEGVINVASLQAAGFGNFVGKQLSSITFLNPVCTSVYPNPANGAGFAIVAATLGGVTLGSTCYANCDASTAPPILNANDFQCFLNKFAAQDSYANCDGSTATPVLNANDFQCFLNAFAVGCS